MQETQFLFVKTTIHIHFTYQKIGYIDFIINLIFQEMKISYSIPTHKYITNPNLKKTRI